MGAVWECDPEPLLDDGVFHHIFGVGDQLMERLKCVVHIGWGSGGHFLLMREQLKFRPEHWTSSCFHVEENVNLHFLVFKVCNLSSYRLLSHYDITLWNRLAKKKKKIVGCGHSIQQLLTVYKFCLKWIESSNCLRNLLILYGGRKINQIIYKHFKTNQSKCVFFQPVSDFCMTFKYYMGI